MGDTSPQLNPDLVYDLFGGIFKPQLIRLALQLDVFTPLAAGSTTAEQIAQSCHCDTFGMKSLLDYLCSLQVLECQGNIYALTPTIATFMVKGRVEPGWSLASFDALTADSLTAYLMDFEVSGIPYLCMIHDLGLGKLYPKDKINIIGEKPDHLITHFKPYRKFANALKKAISH